MEKEQYRVFKVNLRHVFNKSTGFGVENLTLKKTTSYKYLSTETNITQYDETTHVVQMVCSHCHRRVPIKVNSDWDLEQMRSDTKRYSKYIFLILTIFLAFSLMIDEYRNNYSDRSNSEIFFNGLVGGIFYGISFALFIHVVMGIISMSLGHGEKIAHKLNRDKDHVFNDLDRDMGQRTEWKG